MTGARRTFIEAREIPGLVAAALAGRASGLRRVLGARRGGRYGALLLLAAALLAAPASRLPALAVAYFAFGAALWLGQRREPHLRLREVLRAGLWTAVPLVALAIPLRFVWPASGLPALTALGLGYLLLARSLALGLEDRPEQD